MSEPQNWRGYRPTNAWNAGDLPAPWAEGDRVTMVNGSAVNRLRGIDEGTLYICYATSVGDGDEWYFRVTDGDLTSDRLHVAPVARRTGNWGDVGDVDYMAAFRLVGTADPAGLELRERILAAGWRPPHRPVCPTCGIRLPEEDEG